MGARNGTGREHSVRRDASRRGRGHESGFPQIAGAEKCVIKHHLGGVISQSFGATEPTFRSRAALVQLRGAYRLAAQARLPGHSDRGYRRFRGTAGLTNSTRAASSKHLRCPLASQRPAGDPQSAARSSAWPAAAPGARPP